MVQDVHGLLPACATIAPVKFLLITVVRSGGGRPRDRPPPGDAWAHSLPRSRWSMKRTVGSGSEPRYLPVMSYTSCRGLVLFCARTPEAVPAIRTRAMAVFINMVVSYRGVAHTLLACVPI